MKSVYIKEIEIQNGSGFLLLSDGKHECRAFSYPCLLEKGEEIKGPIFAQGYSSEPFLLLNEASLTLEKASNGELDTFIVAKIIEPISGLCEVGSFKIIIELPDNCERGSLVQCRTFRLDVY